MSALPYPDDRPATLADRLAAARRRRFVGRTAELDLFRGMVQATEPPFVVLFVYGPGGVGKTSLLGEYARRAQEWGVPTFRLDGRDLEPSPEGFSLALDRALGGEPGGSAVAALANRPRSVLLLDTFEQVEAILEDLSAVPVERGLRVVPIANTDAARSRGSSPIPTRMPVVNGIASLPASSIVRSRTAGRLSGEPKCGPPLPARRSDDVSSISPIDALTCRNRASSS